MPCAALCVCVLPLYVCVYEEWYLSFWLLEGLTFPCLHTICNTIDSPRVIHSCPSNHSTQWPVCTESHCAGLSISPSRFSRQNKNRDNWMVMYNSSKWAEETVAELRDVGDYVSDKKWIKEQNNKSNLDFIRFHFPLCHLLITMLGALSFITVTLTSCKPSVNCWNGRYMTNMHANSIFFCLICFSLQHTISNA